jgi:hypothetical protein
MQIRVTNGDGQTTELIAVAEPDPNEPTFKYTDVDGDRIVVNTADIDGVPGIYIRTDHAGCSVPAAEVPLLVASTWATAQHMAHKLGQLPCPHPRCLPCSTERTTEG